jgi:hypothetical protein
MQMNSFPDFAMDGVRESRLFFRISGKWMSGGREGRVQPDMICAERVMGSIYEVSVREPGMSRNSDFLTFFPNMC